MECSPDEDSSNGIFIPFGSEGRLAEPGEALLPQISIIYKRLLSSWPQLQLDLCGQTTPEGAAEYNLTLGQGYAEQIKKKVVDLGVPAERIKTISGGENPCPHSMVFHDELSNGVWAAFLLEAMEQALHATSQNTYASADVVQLKGVLYDKKTREKITGTILSYFPSGGVQQELLCIDGMPEGITREYYESGALKNELSCKNGLLHGVSKTYYETGELSSEVPSRNDLPHGTVIYYNLDGTIASQKHYVDGVSQERLLGKPQ